MLLIVMYEASTWRLVPGETFTFGRSPGSSAVLPAGDRGLSRNAGSFSYHVDAWWLRNDSRSSLLYLSGDLGFRVDLPPGMRVPLEQWHLKVRLHGTQGDQTIRLRLPDFDEEPDLPEDPDAATDADLATGDEAAARAHDTATHRRPPLSEDDRLVLAARFEEYLTWRHAGAPVPRSAAETAGRIGWQAHTVTKRCENIRNRFIRAGAPGLRGQRALEELARLLISTGTLTSDDLKRLPPQTGSD